jgi:hypothetical protein
VRIFSSFLAKEIEEGSVMITDKAREAGVSTPNSEFDEADSTMLRTQLFKLFEHAPMIQLRTGFIDSVASLCPEDFEGEMAKGLDHYGRAFFAVKVRVRTPEILHPVQIWAFYQNSIVDWNWSVSGVELPDSFKGNLKLANLRFIWMFFRNRRLKYFIGQEIVTAMIVR